MSCPGVSKEGQSGDPRLLVFSEARKLSQLWCSVAVPGPPLLAGAGIELPKYSGPECVQLALTLTNGDSIDITSPFVEIGQLVKDIDAAKSGALVVKNTTAAADALDQLVPLLNDGILTQEEFDRAKDGFLGATVEVRESSAGLLRQLHSLHKRGVLSESEFNMKKWDILSKDE